MKLLLLSGALMFFGVGCGAQPGSDNASNLNVADASREGQEFNAYVDPDSCFEVENIADFATSTSEAYVEKKGGSYKVCNARFEIAIDDAMGAE